MLWPLKGPSLQEQKALTPELAQPSRATCFDPKRAQPSRAACFDGAGAGARAGTEPGAGGAGLLCCGLGWGLAGLAWARWVGNPETEISLLANETEIGLFENRKMCLPHKNEVPDGQHQQAISIYFFLEGLGFRGLGFRVK